MPCTATKRGKREKQAKPKDETRFNCPYPGCDRSCAELWRLKVHFRAPPDNKGSGVERGHNAELEYCPRCFTKLEAGKHHVGCRSGLAAPRQALKREERNQEARERKERPKRSRSQSSAGESHDSGRRTESGKRRLPSGGAKEEAFDNEAASSGSTTSAWNYMKVPKRPSTKRFFSSLGGGIQLQRSTSRHSEASHQQLATDCVLHIAAPATYLDCEIDDEVVIPKCFAPLLSFPQDLYLPQPPQPPQPFRPAFPAVVPQSNMPTMNTSQVPVWSTSNAPPAGLATGASDLGFSGALLGVPSDLN